MSNSSLEQSVKDRLKNIAQETGKDFNFVSIQYLQERFLARLDKSPYRENLILKGALLLLSYNIPAVRPSKDIDFKGDMISNEIDDIASVIRSIAEIELKDGVQFYPDDMNIQQITEDAEYGGLRIKIAASVSGDRHRLQLDIGFGDIIVDGPVDMDYPSILNFSSPNIKVYSIESSIAEKLEAIVSLGTFGSRMKDYFDVWFLIYNYDLNKERVGRAIRTTFTNRNTPLKDFEYIFSEEFKTDSSKQQQWQAFLNRTSIEAEGKFEEVVNTIDNYISSIIY